MAFAGELKPFQKEAFDMMLEKQSALLAVTMGGGKTVVTIATCEELLETGKADLVLVVVPSSLKYQWASSLDQFAPDATYVVVDGSPSRRLAHYTRAHKDAEYLICNYEQVVNDWDVFFKDVPCDVMVVDEVQAIKSFRSKRSKHIKAIRPPYRFGLTGQPVENRAEEVFSIMEWVDPDLLGNFRTFDRTFIKRNHWGAVEEYVNLDLLHRTLRSKMFRRSYDDIKHLLPEVTTREQTVPLGRRVHGLYKTIAEHLIAELDNLQGSGGFDVHAHYGRADEESDGTRGRVMAMISALRMCTDDARLLVHSARKWLDADTSDGSEYAAGLLDAGVLDDVAKNMDRPSRKVTEALNLLLDVVGEGRKVVLFSTFKQTLYWLEELLDTKGVGSVLFHGEMNPKAKEMARQDFLTNPDAMVFLSSDAGGTGLDLPNASVLVNFNFPWSAGQIQQRDARIRRLSSAHERVHVVNLLCENTVDERMLAMLRKKQEIGDAVVDGKIASTGAVSMVELGTLKNFLKATL